MRTLTNGNAGNFRMPVRPKKIRKFAPRDQIFRQLNRGGVSRRTFASFADRYQLAAEEIKDIQGYNSGKAKKVIDRATKVSKLGRKLASRGAFGVSAAISAFNEVQRLPANATFAQKLAAGTVGLTKEVDNFIVGGLLGTGAGLLMLNPVTAAALGAGLGIAYGFSPVNKLIDRGVGWFARKFSGGLYK